MGHFFERKYSVASFCFGLHRITTTNNTFYVLPLMLSLAPTIWSGNTENPSQYYDLSWLVWCGKCLPWPQSHVSHQSFILLCHQLSLSPSGPSAVFHSFPGNSQLSHSSSPHQVPENPLIPLFKHCNAELGEMVL